MTGEMARQLSVDGKTERKWIKCISFDDSARSGLPRVVNEKNLATSCPSTSASTTCSAISALPPFNLSTLQRCVSKQAWDEAYKVGKQTMRAQRMLTIEFGSAISSEKRLCSFGAVLGHVVFTDNTPIELSPLPNSQN